MEAERRAEPNNLLAGYEICRRLWMQSHGGSDAGYQEWYSANSRSADVSCIDGRENH